MYTLATTLYTTLAIHQQRSSYPFQAKVYNVYVYIGWNENVYNIVANVYAFSCYLELIFRI